MNCKHKIWIGEGSECYVCYKEAQELSEKGLEDKNMNCKNCRKKLYQHQSAHVQSPYIVWLHKETGRGACSESGRTSGETMTVLCKHCRKEIVLDDGEPPWWIHKESGCYSYGCPKQVEPEEAEVTE